MTGHIALAPFVLFAIVFFWTPPHTWALAFRYRADYAAAQVPMLPVVRSAPAVARQILIYSVVTVAVSLALWPVAHTGWLYPSVAGVAGLVFLVEAVQLYGRARAWAHRRGPAPDAPLPLVELVPGAGLRGRGRGPAPALTPSPLPLLTVVAVVPRTCPA